MKRQQILGLAVLALFLFGSACTSTETDTGKDPRFAEVDKLFAEWDKPDSPGCAVGVIQDGEFIYGNGYGMANLDYNIPMTPQSVVYIASTSKQFTAACIALLIHRGELGYEDDIRKYFPEIPDYGTLIKVKHLVHHTSGVRDYLGLMSLAGLSFQDYFNNESALEWIVKQKALNFTPGDEYTYSNSGYVLMAELVQRVSGKTLREYADENIFQPLGMKASHFNDDRSLVVKNRVISYQPIEEDEEATEVDEEKAEKTEDKKEVTGYKRLLKNFDAVGDGDLLTTVEDLFRWDQNFYHHTVGGDGFIDLILTRGKLNDGEELDYAFGLTHGEYKGLKTVSHGGGMLGFRTEMIRFPEQKFTAICLSNLATFNPNGYCKKIADIFISDHYKEKPSDDASAEQKEAKAISLDPTILEAYTGKYRLDIGPVVNIIKEDDQLNAEIPGQPKMKLMPLSETSFMNEKTGAEMIFQKDEKGEFTQIVIKVGGMEIKAEKIEIKSASAEQLQEYVGDYYSSELDTAYKLSLEEKILYVTVRKNPSVPLEMTDKDTFAAAQFTINFKRDSQNRIIGFSLDAGRVKNLEFNRQ
jgi:CubicO group peptidase (beta-lactamase class C family)